MIKTSILTLLIASSGWAAQAQSTGGQAAPNQVSTQDTTRKYQNHREWKEKGQGSSLSQEGGFTRGRRFQRNGIAGMPPVHFTPEQRKQVMAIHSDFRSREEALYAQNNLTLGVYKAQLVELQKARKAKLQAVLTPVQQEQIANWKARRSENQQVMAAARLERMKIDLKLTDEQTAKIKTQDETFRARMQTIRNNDDLLPEEKRTQIRAAFAQQKDAIAALLAPDQQASLKTEFQERGRLGRKGRHMPSPADN